MEERIQESGAENTAAVEKVGSGDVALAKEEKRLTPPAYYESRTQLFPSWFDILAMLGLFLVSQLITKLIFSTLGLEIISSDDIADMTTLQQRNAEFEMGYNVFIWSVISQPLMVLLVVIYRFCRGGKAFVVKWSMRGFDPIILLWGIVLLLSTSVVIEPLMELLPKSPIPDGRGLFMIASLLVVAPFFEELLCRGIIFEAIRSKRGAWAACIISSLLFGMMHLEPQFVLNAFVVGIILSYLYLRTNSIFAPMLLHAFNNTLSYLLLMFGLSQSSLSDLVGSGTIYTVIYSISAAVLFIAIIAISRHISKVEREANAKERAEAEAKMDVK